MVDGIRLNNEITTLLRFRRNLKKMTQVELAEKVGMSRQRYFLIAHGRTMAPEEDLRKIFNVLDIKDADEIIAKLTGKN